ncbi:MAG TPA: hypothetical protein VM029_17540 [Opitutaceae bacterium]|nr:hypothetical protein [Opitutaceae bacterium]
MPATICLITPGHVSSTPRVVKEADALAAAGYRVHVVAGRHFGPVRPFDDVLAAASAWQYRPVTRGIGGALLGRLTRRIARSLMAGKREGTVLVAARAIHAQVGRLAAAAAATGADYFVGHCLGGLAAAALAAEKLNARFGCDLEDFHDAETEAALNDPAQRNATQRLQSVFLPRAAHLTAASPLIARAYEEKYHVRPHVVLNVFPLREAPAAPLKRPPPSAEAPARLYWFSQTIGSGRGLEALVAIVGRMRTPVELQLRGFGSRDYTSRLTALARTPKAEHAVHVLPPAPAGEMVRLAADADLGLSIEESMPLNRDLCLTNKIFVYLLAGLPQLLSATSAQTALAPELGEAALLGDLARPEETAARLDAFFGDPARVARGRESAWRIARARFCWDREKDKFLAAIRPAVGGPS